MSATRLTAGRTTLEALLPWRERYRAEMGCQIIRDSLHVRSGWTEEFALFEAGVPVGYGSVVVGGPWEGKPTIFEFFLAPESRVRAAALFKTLLAASGAIAIETQSNDPFLDPMMARFATDVREEKILFEDRTTTALSPPDVRFRLGTTADFPDLTASQVPWHGVLELDGAVVARGGVLLHYNPPYGDVYMEVAPAFRRRGFGSFLVQELKRVCREAGRIPGARCDPTNAASRHSLEKAGFAVCGRLLSGALAVR